MVLHSSKTRASERKTTGIKLKELYHSDKEAFKVLVVGDIKKHINNKFRCRKNSFCSWHYEATGEKVKPHITKHSVNCLGWTYSVSFLTKYDSWDVLCSDESIKNKVIEFIKNIYIEVVSKLDNNTLDELGILL